MTKNPEHQAADYLRKVWPRYTDRPTSDEPFSGYDVIQAYLAGYAAEKADAEQQQYYIWSFQHSSWWAPDSLGYTKNIHKAGKYSYNEARSICIGANVLEEIDEAMVPVTMNYLDIPEVKP